MDGQTDKDFNLLSEENSDFDILLSPASGKSDDDDEVFLGPVRHVEKCVAIGIDLNCKEEKSLKSAEIVNWSPLNTDQFVEVSREANLLALHFENHVEGKSEKMGNEMIHSKNVEQFIEESKLKLTLLRGISSPSCPRRETFVVQDSPLRLLPLAIQKSLQVCSSNARPGFLLKSPKKAVVQVINSSVQPLQNCRNPTLGNDDVACTESITLREVPLGEQPTWTSEKGSQPKVSGSKVSGSVKKQSAGMAVRTLNHASSSISSVHSGLHNSASGGKVVSMNVSLNSSKLQNSKNGSRIVAPKSKSSSTCAIDVPKTKLMKPANTCQLTTPGKMNQQGSGMQTLPFRGLQRSGSIDMKVETKIKSNQVVNALGKDPCAKTKTSIIPSLVSKRSSAPSPRTTKSKITEPKKLLSCGAIESVIEACTPNKPPIRGMLQTPNVPNRLTSVTPGTRRLSALPTPLNRRRSVIPTFTPQTQPRLGSLSRQAIANQNRSMSACGTILASEQKMSRKPPALCSSDSSEEEISPPLVPCFLDFSPDKPQTVCQVKTVEHTSETQIMENLLVEVNTKNKQIEDHPLIDLSNTPDLKRVAPMKAPEPLIDFSSPLITLSPENKENVNMDSPLLKF
ncbi:G2 and S phase-expressed protein 1-like isoform X2 [Carcharodon carcharias]|uniref:G2 and S phase-expressed protein 1-like isoform X2 n=1 Tax=Carcharodon carcharias TaxID=13397 RepID=UPI001B7F6E32|nr:G2 and S phase-expressed protein 1-like isoform X2 [Carcharodon carcharias]